MPMPAQVGRTFQPTTGMDNSQKDRNAKVQEAIKLLSLRLPSVVGARPVAPGQLLAGQGAGGLGAGGGESGIQLLRRLLAMAGGGSMPGMTSGAPMGGGMAPSTPTPRIGVDRPITTETPQLQTAPTIPNGGGYVGGLTKGGPQLTTNDLGRTY